MLLVGGGNMGRDGQGRLVAAPQLTDEARPPGPELPGVLGSVLSPRRRVCGEVEVLEEIFAAEQGERAWTGVAQSSEAQATLWPGGQIYNT